MTKKTYDRKIDKHTNWSGDRTTNNLPVTGRRVQEFIKETLSKKVGAFLFDEDRNRYLIFSDKEDEAEYIQSGGMMNELIISEIEMTTPSVEAAIQNVIDVTKKLENISSHPNKIVNDYWWKWNYQTQEYENTGIEAKGDKGEKGDGIEDVLSNYLGFHIDEEMNLILTTPDNYHGVEFELVNGELNVIL